MNFSRAPGRARGLLLLRRPGEGAAPGSAREPSARTDLDAPSASVIVCRTCGNPVSSSERLVSPTGSGSKHVFANPAGRVFEIITVAVVFGVHALGPPTIEHTWFAGRAWRAIVCARCGAHLGWRFDAPGARPFWGLITSEVAETARE